DTPGQVHGRINRYHRRDLLLGVAAQLARDSRQVAALEAQRWRTISHRFPRSIRLLGEVERTIVALVLGHEAARLAGMLLERNRTVTVLGHAVATLRLCAGIHRVEQCPQTQKEPVLHAPPPVAPAAAASPESKH